MFQFRAFYRLIRVPNLPSAASNILMAYFVANGSWQPAIPLVLLLAASLSLYAAGMVLNDWHDADRDRRERPDRPIPAGQVSQRGALALFGGLACGGLLAATAAAAWSGWNLGRFDWTPIAIAAALCFNIWLYDVALKQTIWAAPLMGGCRFWNVLLGASLMAPSADRMAGWLGLPPAIWCIAINLGVYVTGLTWFARREATTSLRGQLVGGALLVGLGLAGFFALDRLAQLEISELPHATGFRWLIGLTSAFIGLRMIMAIAQPTSYQVKLGVVTLLRNMIVIDAALIYLFSPGAIWPALAVLGLIPVSLWLGRYSHST